MTRLLLAAATCAAIIQVVSTSAEAAQCFSHGSVGSSGTFCNNCVLQDVLIVKRDEPCERSYWTGSSSRQVVQFLSNRITQRAKHGVAGTTGSSLAYAPAKGYTGPDDFTVGVDFKDNSGAGKFYIHFAVTVQ